MVHTAWLSWLWRVVGWWTEARGLVHVQPNAAPPHSVYLWVRIVCGCVELTYYRGWLMCRVIVCRFLCVRGGWDGRVINMWLWVCNSLCSPHLNQVKWSTILQVPHQLPRQPHRLSHLLQRTGKVSNFWRPQCSLSSGYCWDGGWICLVGQHWEVALGCGFTLSGVLLSTLCRDQVYCVNRMWP